MPETVLKNGHSLKGKNVTLELIKAYRAFGILYSGFNYARMTTDTKSEEMSLAELRKAFTGITGQSPDDYFDIMAIDITETHMRQLLHVTIVKANEFGQPDGHDLRVSFPRRLSFTIGIFSFKVVFMLFSYVQRVQYQVDVEHVINYFSQYFMCSGKATRLDNQGLWVPSRSSPIFRM